MISIKKMRIFQILLLVLAFTLSNCTSNEYDLKSVNTEITVGGDSLTFPIGKTKKILLGSLLDGQSTDILKKSQSGAYLLQLKDSTAVNVPTLSPVSFSIAPISITPISTNFATVQIPAFQISPVNISSNLPFPTIDFSAFTIAPIYSTFNKVIDLSSPSQVKKQFKVNGSNKSRSQLSDFSTGLIKYHDQETISQSLVFNYPTELKKINTIFLKNNTVTLSINKTDINDLGFTTQNDTINFKIDFPPEYVLSSNVGSGTKIVGSSFIIEKAVQSATQGVYTATFKIDKLDMSAWNQSLGSLIYSKDIPYSIDYSFIGTTSNPALINATPRIIITLTSAPSIDDMDILTNDFLVTVPGGSNPINQVIPIPPEISSVNSLTFDNGANLQLNIADPGITPFTFKAGNCIIQLPQKFIFKPFEGDPSIKLDLSLDNISKLPKNILTIPYNQLFGIKNIGISGMTINQSVPTGSSSITLSDNLSYSIVGLNVASQAIKVNAINSMTGKTINVVGTISGLTISNTNVVTNSISIDVPDQSTNVDINQFVSNDVKTIYSFTLRTPSALTFNIGINGIPTAIDSLFFRDYTIQFPSFLKFKAGDVDAQNRLILNGGFKVVNGFTKALTIQNIDFGVNGIALVNGVFNLHQPVTMTGSVYIKGANLNSNDLSTVIISPIVTIGSMSIAQITGKISTTIQPISQNIPINLPSFLSSGASVLDIVNPVMTLEIGNTMGIPVNLDLTLTPKKGGIVQTAGIINTNKINIAPASVLGQTTWSRYWISNSCKGFSAGFDTINVPLPNLLKSIPDQILISAVPTITGDKQTIDLSSSNNMLNLKYSVSVPLSFGKDFVIQYIDTIADLQKSLADILKYAHQVDIIAIVENSIPLELSLEATALNSSKGVISGVTISSPDKIKSGNADGTAQTSKITISLSESSTGALQLLDALKLKISAKSNSTVAGLALNSNQYITLELRVRIPKGITINPSSTK